MNGSREIQLVHFGVFEADFRSGELRRSGTRVRIQDLPFRALKILVYRPNEVVTRDDLRQALWPPDIFVDFDRAISSAIKRLRDALGDSADNPIFIETLERRGYRWIAPVSIVSAAPAPLVHNAVATPPINIPPPTRPDLVPSRWWKLVYLLPVFTLLLVAWSFRSGFRSARASTGSHPDGLRGVVHPANTEARDLYLQGRYYWNKRTPDDLHKAVDRFTQAIVHDPGYSDAYVGLADCYNLLREYTDMPGREAYPRALAAARRAVELDDNSSQAHASLAFSSFWGAWDPVNADREFRRAIELDPNNARAHHWYSTYLDAVGRFQQALAEIERAQALDPTSRSILADKAIMLDRVGRRDEAVQSLLQMERTEPEFMSPHRYLKGIYLEMGDYPGYLAERRKEAILTHDSVELTVVAAAEKGYAAGGPQAMFESIRRQQEKVLGSEGKSSAYILAETCARAGDNADAVKYLKAAYEQRDEYMPELGVDHAFDKMRDDPTVKQLTASLGLPSIQAAYLSPAK